MKTLGLLTFKQNVIFENVFANFIKKFKKIDKGQHLLH